MAQSDRPQLDATTHPFETPRHGGSFRSDLQCRNRIFGAIEPRYSTYTSLAIDLAAVSTCEWELHPIGSATSGALFVRPG